ncbi:MAG TPA: M28 family peptidase [Thermomicrobiales bacterium]|nr:M28 family peptidase [Thermomicrobiales bacterium]
MAESDIRYQQQIIGDIWTSDAPYRNLEEFCDVIGSRWAASESEHRGGEFLKARLESYGLQNVRLEPVEFGGWTRGDASLVMTAPVAESFSCIALPYCPTGEIEAELIDAGNGESSDFERLGEAVRGKIVIAAGETNAAGAQAKKLAHRTDKLRFAADAGAIGFIFVNQNPGLLHISGGIGAPGGKPAAIFGVGTSWEHGQKILRLAARGGGAARVRLSVGGSFFPNTSYNVVGEIPGSGKSDELVVVGAHYDGHDISQAALDDGAGTMVALEAARVLAALPAEAIGRTIRVVLFCGEEVGLFGSWAYTADHEDERDRTRFMVNLDGAGRGKGGAESLTLSGRPELMPYFRSYIADSNYKLALTDDLSSHSDHFPYAIRGIPTASIKSPDDSAALVGRGWGHTEADTFDKATLRGLQMSAMVTARLLLQVASDDEFPGQLMSREDLQQQLTDLELDVALKRSGRWSLVGGPA